MIADYYPVQELNYDMLYYNLHLVSCVNPVFHLCIIDAGSNYS